MSSHRQRADREGLETMHSETYYTYGFHGARTMARHVFREVETGQVEDETICAKGSLGECL